jgi:chromate transport protein ChrA
LTTTISTAHPIRTDPPAHQVPVKIGLAVIVLFFVAFSVFMSLRGGLHPSPLLLSLFNNMFLAGTIIFGGGPVVIPLLRNYVVDPGWVSPRDFLLGLAIIQAMPGPNFNFAVYLGALVAASNSNVPSVVGAILGYLGIFVPGLWLSVGFQSIWQSLRKRREVSSILRGINATAVGFVFTAVYRLWEIGYLTPEETKGISLANEPWWLVIATITYAAVEWFFVPPPVAILSGGALGLAWYGAVGRPLEG